MKISEAGREAERAVPVMSALGSKLRSLEGGMVSFFCPGCGYSHAIGVGTGPGARWTFNGNSDRPTFKPSVLVTSGCKTKNFKPGDSCWCTYNSEHPENPATFKCGTCHSFVTDGQIQFLGDCTHALAGQTVPLPDYPSGEPT